MAKKKVFGVLESEAVLLEPVSETRYRLNGEIDTGYVGQWLTVQGQVKDESIANAAVASVEKNTGKVTRSGTLVMEAPNLPPEANGQGGYLYQPTKGRYLLLSSGATDEPVAGDFSQFEGQAVKVRGQFGASNYILYNAKVSAK